MAAAIVSVPFLSTRKNFGSFIIHLRSLRIWRSLGNLIPNAWLTLWPVRRTTSAIRTRNSRPPKMAAAIVFCAVLVYQEKLRLLHHSLEKVWEIWRSLGNLIPNAWLTLWPVRRTTSAIRTKNSRPPKMAAAIVSVPFLSTRKNFGSFIIHLTRLRIWRSLGNLIPNAWLTLWPVRRTTSAIRTRN